MLNFLENSNRPEIFLSAFLIVSIIRKMFQSDVEDNIFSLRFGKFFGSGVTGLKCKLYWRNAVYLLQNQIAEEDDNNKIVSGWEKCSVAFSRD